MDPQARQVDPAQMEELQRQMAHVSPPPMSSSNIPLMPQNNQTQNTPQVASPIGAPQGGGTAAIRQRMQASRGAAPPPPTVITQGDTYNPTPTTQAPTRPVQPTIPLPAQSAQPNTAPTQVGSTSTIINTTSVDTQGSGNDNGSEKKKFNPMIAIGIFIGIAVLGVLLMVFSKKPDGNEVPSENPDGVVSEDDLVWIDPVVDTETFYTQDQINKLREVGYTGTEIEQFALNGEDVNAKIREAEAIRDAWLQEAIAPLYDATSQEYKDFISQTWLTLPERKDLGEWTQVAGYYQERKNLDYEKVTVYGNQLFIKIYLDDDVHADWFFLNVTPEEWIKLKDQGNVIVTYTYCTRYVTSAEGFNVEDFSNTFITSAVLEIIE